MCRLIFFTNLNIVSHIFLQMLLQFDSFFFFPSLILSSFHLGPPIIWMLDFSSCLWFFFFLHRFSSCFWAWIFYNNLFFDHEFLYLYFLKQWLPCKVNYFTFQFCNLLVVFVDFYFSSEVLLSILLRSFIRTLKFV